MNRILPITAAIGVCCTTALTGYAQDETVTRTVSSFDAVELSGAFDVRLRQSNKPGVTIETDNIEADEIVTEVRGSTLHIRMKSKDYDFDDDQKITIDIAFTELTHLSNRGAGNIVAETPISGDSFELAMSGAGNTDLDVDVDELEVTLSGAGSISVRGNAKKQTVSLSGAGNYNGYELIAEDTNVKLSGVGNAKVYASRRINASASGIGSVRYKGNPKEVVKSSSGMLGSVKSVD